MKAYKQSGVDINAGYKAIDLIKKHTGNTYIPGVLSDIGSFSGLFSLANFKDMQEPTLAAGTDGVGTKLKIAFIMDKHDTVGIDCVAYSINDIICCGAKPLMFLDYLACGKLNPERVGQIVQGVAKGCVLAGCALIGGETAEMPGFYPDDEYDLAGTAIGIVDKKDIIDGSQAQSGDVIIGIASSGLHSNGYSLVRKIINPTKHNICQYINEFGKTLGEELLIPTKIYAKTIIDLQQKIEIKGISNITGGGFDENIPRMLKKGLGAKIETSSWDIPPIFSYIQKNGKVDNSEMYSVFNMGVGLALVVSEDMADQALLTLNDMGEAAYIIGSITDGDGVKYV